MSEIDNRLELLIGKSLDGEISPGERQWLDRELDTNNQARELFEQLQCLRRCSHEAIAAEVFQGGASAEDIFERAWQQNVRPSRRRIFRADGHLRFAAGIAAGLVLSLTVQYVLERSAKSAAPSPRSSQIVQDVRSDTMGQTAVAPVVESQGPGGVTREVDWYVFTDAAGDQWLIEGIREGMVKPASYSDELH